MKTVTMSLGRVFGAGVPVRLHLGFRVENRARVAGVASLRAPFVLTRIEGNVAWFFRYPHRPNFKFLLCTVVNINKICIASKHNEHHASAPSNAQDLIKIGLSTSTFLHAE